MATSTSQLIVSAPVQKVPVYINTLPYTSVLAFYGYRDNTPYRLPCWAVDQAIWTFSNGQGPTQVPVFDPNDGSPIPLPENTPNLFLKLRMRNVDTIDATAVDTAVIAAANGNGNGNGSVQGALVNKATLEVSFGDTIIGQLVKSSPSNFTPDPFYLSFKIADGVADTIRKSADEPYLKIRHSVAFDLIESEIEAIVNAGVRGMGRVVNSLISSTNPTLTEWPLAIALDAGGKIDDQLRAEAKRVDLTYIRITTATDVNEALVNKLLDDVLATARTTIDANKLAGDTVLALALSDVATTALTVTTINKLNTQTEADIEKNIYLNVNTTFGGTLPIDGIPVKLNSSTTVDKKDLAKSLYKFSQDFAGVGYKVNGICVNQDKVAQFAAQSDKQILIGRFGGQVPVDIEIWPQVRASLLSKVSITITNCNLSGGFGPPGSTFPYCVALSTGGQLVRTPGYLTSNATVAVPGCALVAPSQYGDELDFEIQVEAPSLSGFGQWFTAGRMKVNINSDVLGNPMSVPLNFSVYNGQPYPVGGAAAVLIARA